MGPADEEFILFTSFKRDGGAVGLPVWVVPVDGGRLGFTTAAGSLKVKRISRNPRVTIQGCDRRGKTTHGPVYQGTARLGDPAETEQVRRAVRAKYKVLARLIDAAVTTSTRLRGGGASQRTAVIITLDEGSAGA